MSISIFSEVLLPSIATILKVTVMSSICVFATLFSLIIVQIHEVWVPKNGIIFIPDFLKFGHVMMKLGTQRKTRTHRRARASVHTHTPRLSHDSFFTQKVKFVKKCISAGHIVLNQYAFQLWLSCCCNGSAFLLFHCAQITGTLIKTTCTALRTAGSSR